MQMKTTFFDTPILRTLLRWTSLFLLKISGWKRSGELPSENKYIIIAAPHTTNWDMPLTLMLAFAFKVKIYWLGKKSLFKFPFSTIMQWMGGIPVDRSKNNNMVEAAIELFKKTEKLILAVPPEGTRQRVRYWKTGFYHMAFGANVPIATGFLDYRTKTGGFGPLIIPTGDLESDMILIQKFYSTITGKYPDQHNQADIDDRNKMKKPS
jgi:1-acyl-sn-glycerol-3-phosphate acyltransferase